MSDTAPTSVSSPHGLALAVGREDCLKLEIALTREWLETDGLGGFASGTVLGCPTRRYHGLLLTRPPGLAKRHLFLAGFDESLHGRSKGFALSMWRYRELWHPHGHQWIERFELAPWPRFVYRIGQAEVRREIVLCRGTGGALVRWSISGVDHAVELRLRPLLACREADALTRENVDLDPRVERLEAGIRCRPYASLPPVALAVGGAAARFEADPVWYRGLEYREELARGYEGHEDLFSPGVYSVTLEPDGSAVIAGALDEPPAAPVQAWQRESELRLREQAAARAGLRGQLELAAPHFLYAAPRLADAPAQAPGAARTRTGVIAGYPWFGEWGRDTFISLPGLLLARGQVEECGQALDGALDYLERGLFPNVLGDSLASSDYGSADAALWFARAVRLYELAGGSRERLLERFLPALLAIARNYAEGTGLGIRCDEQGLLLAGSPAHNASWMDARVDGVPVTPRDGCAVELNALWCFLHEYIELLAKSAGVSAELRDWAALRRRVRQAFLERFWIEDGRYLADVWKDGVQDRRVRPNMVIAAALEFSPLSRGKRTDIVRRAEAELLTPRGLRTLSPLDPDYQGRYGGRPAERDRAYHQGTVWPWLLGFYCEAVLQAYGPNKPKLRQLRALLAGFEEHLGTQGLGQVSEVFDGDPPHRPGGAIAQAWSVAELLRAQALLDEAGA